MSSVGVAGWEAIVYNSNGDTSDSPLPLALSLVVGNNNVLYHLLITIGLFGLIASFHGIILGGRKGQLRIRKGKICSCILKKHSSQIPNTSQCIVGKYGDRHHCLANRQNGRDHYDLSVWCIDIIYCIYGRCAETQEKEPNWSDHLKYLCTRCSL
jgi:hypothetical protein